jgi:hypothetical protein
MECFIWRKHVGELAPPPGGWNYEDEHWRDCHAPIGISVQGHLLARHYAAMKRATGAERVYTLVPLEGAVHFLAWLVPGTQSDTPRDVAFLADDHDCTEDEAVAEVSQIRRALST